MLQEKFLIEVGEIISDLKKNQKDSDFESIKENIRTYADINLVNGSLPQRPLKDFRLTSDASGDLKPSDAEKEDEARHMEALQQPIEKKALPNPSIFRKIIALGEQPDAFFPFSLARNIANCWYVTSALSGYSASARTLKRRYIDSLNQLQNSHISCDPENIVVSFDNPALIKNLIREGVLGHYQVEQQLFQPFEREVIAIRIKDALDFIKAVNIDLHDLIVQFIGTIVCIKRQGSSGTVSSMIGMIWLNPTHYWTVVDYAENIVHEFIHNTIFLADLSQSIFAAPHWYTPKESLVISAMKQYPRGVNIVFHSLYVAIGIIIFLEEAHQDSRGLELTSGLSATIKGLHEKREGLLTEFGKQLLQEVLLNQIEKPVNELS